MEILEPQALELPAAMEIPALPAHLDLKEKLARLASRLPEHPDLLYVLPRFIHTFEPS